jgi:hypothetical protein
MVFLFFSIDDTEMSLVPKEEERRDMDFFCLFLTGLVAVKNKSLFGSSCITNELKQKQFFSWCGEEEWGLQGLTSSPSSTIFSITHFRA